MNNVVGVDLTKYIANSKEHPKESFFGAPQENVEFRLESDTSKLSYLCTFTKEKLHILHLIEKDGAPHMTKSTNNVVDVIKDFLDNYQKHTKNSFYGELTSMLDSVNPNANSTTTKENIKFEVSISNDHKTFSWSYTINGLDAARKCVAFVFKNGVLELFVDTWDLYEIGSTDVNLSEEEAIDIAMRTAETFSWDLVDGNKTLKITNFKVTEAIEKYLVFGVSSNADNIRSEDLLTLYPMWRIGVGLDKFYPGNVFGIYVDIWADTKEVRKVKTATTNVDPELIPDAEIATIEESIKETGNDSAPVSQPQSNSMFAPLLVFPVLFAILGCVSFWIVHKKNSILSFQWKKLRRNKIDVPLAFFLVSLILAVQVSCVYAANPMGRATIWGSLAPYKETQEIQLQDSACDYIWGKFDDNGYIATDYQGAASVQATLLNSIDSNEANYPRVATVWFDHGIGDFPIPAPYDDEWHYRIIDSNDVNYDGDYVWIFDYEIYEKTWRQKTFFAFISTCMSAKLDLINPLTQQPLGTGTYGANTGGSGEIIGMPYAWTHGATLDYTGYSSPDSGPFCYIGFPWGSPSLDQEVDSANYAGIEYYDWVLDFFKYALDYDMTINQALDHASYECFPPNYFGTTALHLNFTTIWPGSPSYPDCTMEVYGNGNLKLYQPQVEVRAYDDYSNPVSTPVYIDGYYVGNSFGTYGVAPGSHTVQVSNSPSSGLVFSHFGGYPSGQNPITVEVTSDRLLWAYYDNTPMYTLTISTSGSGYTSPSGSPQYQSGTYATVYAYPNQGWSFDHWVLDGQNAGSSSPINVYMNTNHNLQAVFVEDEPPPQYYYVTIEAWGYYPPWMLLYQGTEYMQEGPQQFSAPSVYGGLPFYAWYHNGNYYYDLTIWLSIYSDTYLAAIYSY